jgi:hypothetical protein
MELTSQCMKINADVLRYWDTLRGILGMQWVTFRYSKELVGNKDQYVLGC